MLDFETVDAVERGAFHVYAVDTIDHGIEILTGVRAGTIESRHHQLPRRQAPARDGRQDARTSLV